MPMKRQWLIISFSNTHTALQAEKLLQQAQVSGLLIPTPRSITASCGLCWRTEPENQNAVRQAIEGLQAEAYTLIWS